MKELFCHCLARPFYSFDVLTEKQQQRQKNAMLGPYKTGMEENFPKFWSVLRNQVLLEKFVLKLKARVQITRMFRSDLEGRAGSGDKNILQG